MDINSTERGKINLLPFSIISFSLWFVYSYFVIFPNKEIINHFFLDYSNDLAVSPYRYRVLITDVVLIIGHFLNINNYVIIYTSLMLLVFNFSIFQLISFIKKVVLSADLFWCNIFVAQIFIMVSFSFHFYQPWSFLDIGLYSFFYRQLFSTKKNSVLFFILFTLALLNRETGIFIATLFVIHSFLLKDNKRVLLRNILFFAYGIGILLALRVWKGYELVSDSNRVFDIFKENIRPINLLMYLILLISSGLIWLLKIKNIDVRLKSAYINLLLFLPLYVVFGIWIEVRMLLPFLPILILPISEKLVRSFNTLNQEV
jgi:hypothetical protein